MIDDVVIIGAGIVGLATAKYILEQRPGLRLRILDKESDSAAHQTGHNSGVIHSGVYYRPGSQKSIHCRAGKMKLEAYCEEKGIAWKRSGKLIVATEDSQIPQLRELEIRAGANGVEHRWLSREEVKDFEPHVQSVAALSIPEAGVVDYRDVCNAFVDDLKALGAEFQFDTCVDDCRETEAEIELVAAGKNFRAKTVINCAGLYSDRMAKLFSLSLPGQIVPFRGEYYALKAEYQALCRTLIYPVPNPKFPFLGVHLTRGVDGLVTCGPNAVLAFAREGYAFTDFNFKDLMQTITFPGFWKLAIPNMGYGMHEMWRSLSKQSFVRSLQKLVPEVEAHMIEPYPAGVRAQVVHASGDLADDFIIRKSRRSMHVVNAPSPAATSSLALGETIGDEALTLFN